MLAALKKPPRPLLLIVRRRLATESAVNGHSAVQPPLPLPASTKSRPPSHLYPQPRPVDPSTHSNRHPLPKLPPTFGRNQLLPVTDSTRALLESIVAKFNAPIRYAFAYGSGVFEQDGRGKEGEKPPMLDFIFAVTHPEHFHSMNMQQYPAHYPLHARAFGSSYVGRVEDLGPGVWFNAYVPMNGVVIKYGVTSIDNLCNDLLNWRTLYLAGRMHKPLRIIKDDARVRLTQQVNLTSAVRAALLTLPAEFSETQLFETITAISYSGDPRMILPAENRGKVGNIVRKQGPQFKELYQRLVVGLPGTYWPIHQSEIQQDTSARARSFHLRKLPHNLLVRVRERFAERGVGEELMREDENAYWMKLAADEEVLRSVVREEMSRIVRGPATVQTLKGIMTAGIGKSIKYGSAKVGKWWRGS
ncbi:Mmp37-domain-containing protein [Macrolepiota fuliginosa MF-IS2]|uniref:Phosphatidate cytidylyltransferase, mitochondrial n=1 Tax=Macrolepiota fuliginosa MF-IS2 TaxID=1400762 RepID=A0A9P6C6W1_9AGAR|nr:Mmp37-domain-containing protein [Macrolepiota fuliginosa MF-IS2]